MTTKLQRLSDKISTPRITKYKDLFQSRPYTIWSGMKNRCNNKNSDCYHFYGGKGISYDPSWQGFDGFWDDMKDEYKDGLTLDRIDPNKNYSKDNCRWATWQEQGDTRTDNTMISVDGIPDTLSNWARKYNHKPSTVAKRIGRGWDPQRAVTTPNKKSEPLMFTYNGETKHLKEWCYEFGVGFNKAKARNWHGWSIERILNTK